MEIVSPKNRILVHNIQNGFSSLGMASLAGLSWIINDWKITQRIIYIPAIFVILYLWIIDESARWLLVKNRPKDAIKIIRKAERINRVKISETLIEQLYQSHIISTSNGLNIENAECIDLARGQPKNMPTILKEVLKSPTILKRVVWCSFLWVTCTFSFHGFSINSVRLTDNRHLSYVIVSLTQIPAYYTAYLILNRIGRRKTLIIAFILCTIASFTSAFISKEIFWIALIPYIIGKFSITLAFATIYIYTSEIFPTSLRQSLFGTCSTLGRFGSLLAPQVQLISYYVEPLPSILFGLLTLASGILSFTVPETANIKLPDTMKEAENLRKK